MILRVRWQARHSKIALKVTILNSVLAHGNVMVPSESNLLDLALITDLSDCLVVQSDAFLFVFEICRSVCGMNRAIQIKNQKSSIVDRQSNRCGQLSIQPVADRLSYTIPSAVSCLSLS